MEVIVDVVRKDCILSDALADERCTVERLVLGQEITLHKVRFTENADDAKLKLCTMGMKCRSAGNGSVWVQSPSCQPCSFFSSSYFQVLGSRSIRNHRVQYRILLPSAMEIKTLEKRMKEAQLEYEIVGIVPYMHQELTDRQREILKMALDLGYFDEKFRISLTELAEKIGMSPSSLSEILRRSFKKTVDFYFDHRP